MELCYDNEHKLINNPECATKIIDSESSDHLSVMLEMQSELQSRLNNIKEMNDERTIFIMKHALYAEAELHEMLRELNGFKHWKHYDGEEDLSAAKEEFIDALHFFLNIALALDMSSDEIFNIFLKKNIMNHERQDNNY